MRFKTDENVHPEAAALLREHGHDAVTVWDQSMRGSTDNSLAAVCRAEARVIITLDTDFADIRVYPPVNYPGIVVFRLADQSRAHVLRVMVRVVPLLNREPLEGRLWIVDESRVRIRGSESA